MNHRFYIDPETDLPHMYEHGVDGGVARPESTMGVAAWGTTHALPKASGRATSPSSQSAECVAHPEVPKSVRLGVISNGEAANSNREGGI